MFGYCTDTGNKTRARTKTTEPEVVKVLWIYLDCEGLKLEEGDSSKISATVGPSFATNTPLNGYLQAQMWLQ